MGSITSGIDLASDSLGPERRGTAAPQALSHRRLQLAVEAPVLRRRFFSRHLDGRCAGCNGNSCWMLHPASEMKRTHDKKIKHSPLGSQMIPLEEEARFDMRKMRSFRVDPSWTSSSTNCLSSMVSSL